MTQSGRSSGLNPRIIGWGRPLAKVPPTYCGVVDLDAGGSVLTACAGRWSTAEPRDYLEGRDRERDNDGLTFQKCGGCDDVAREQRTMAGLDELRGALVIETRPAAAFYFPPPGGMPPAPAMAERVVFGFDVSDTGELIVTRHEAPAPADVTISCGDQDDEDDEHDDYRGYDDRAGAEDLDDGPSACIGPDCCNPHIYHRRDECFTAEMAEAYAAELDQLSIADDIMDERDGALAHLAEFDIGGES
jgi:hypothetical protein